MAAIKINDLRPVGSELFKDPESYLNELNNQELDVINGASFPTITVPIIITITMM